MLGIIILWRIHEYILHWFFSGYLWHKVVLLIDLITTNEAFWCVYSSLIMCSHEHIFVFGVTSLLPRMKSTFATFSSSRQGQLWHFKCEENKRFSQAEYLESE
jgi:hypothetical protein